MKIIRILYKVNKNILEQGSPFLCHSTSSHINKIGIQIQNLSIIFFLIDSQHGINERSLKNNLIQQQHLQHRQQHQQQQLLLQPMRRLLSVQISTGKHIFRKRKSFNK